MNLILSKEKLDQFEDAKVSMGASIENLHLQAGLLSRLQHMRKCQLIQQKVVGVTPTFTQSERPIVTLEDGT